MMFVFAVSMIITACGGSAEQVAQDSTQVDSVEVVVDSAQLNNAVSAADSAHQIPVK